MSNNLNAAGGSEARSVFRKFQDTLPFRFLVRGFLIATKYTPVRVLRTVGILFVFLFIGFNFRNFRAIRKNLARIKPGLSSTTYARMAFDVFRNYSYYLIDLFHLSHDPGRIRKYRINLRGQENYEAVSSKKNGIIFLTAHMGNWEIGGIKLAALGRGINVVYSPDTSSLLELQRSFVRRTEGVKELPLRKGSFSSLKLLRVLQDGEAIALQGDRMTFDSGVKVKFFGADALLPKGPVKLALVSDSIILPVFMPITGFKSYDIIMERPIVMEKTGDPAKDLETNLSKIIKIFEQYIGRYPTQWYTFMPFWLDDKEEFTNT
jgi:KDO2-lipid IV(A) lauroyltransferase